MIASGAKREMLNNKNYYKTILSKYPRKIPFPHEEPIDLDLHRTFPEHPYYKNEDNIQKLKNILLAFSMRNITIGYCQGFNYIVAKLLLEIEDEEKTFWVFTQLAENYLPFDYYLKFTGVRTDTLIIQKIIKLSRPNLDENIELCISNLITRCFISLFSQNVNDTILYCIWDAFLIYGNITLYRAFLWLVFLIYEKKMNKMSIENIHNAFINKLYAVTDTYTLNYFLMMYIRINEDFIKYYREMYFKKTMNDNYISNEIDKESQCDHSLPFCIFNREGENVSSFRDFNCIRIEKLPPLYDDYFTNILFKDNLQNKLIENKLKEDYDENNDIDMIIIERQKHRCQNANGSKDNNHNNNFEEKERIDDKPVIKEEENNQIQSNKEKQDKEKQFFDLSNKIKAKEKDEFDLGIIYSDEEDNQ